MKPETITYAQVLADCKARRVELPTPAPSYMPGSGCWFGYLHKWERFGDAYRHCPRCGSYGFLPNSELECPICPPLGLPEHKRGQRCPTDPGTQT